MGSYPIYIGIPLFFIIKWIKFIFFIIIVTGTLISISSFSWINIWIGLEINLLAFVPLINIEKTKQSTETSLKYFLVQVTASMFILFVFLYSFITKNSFEQLDKIPIFIFNCAIIIKIGIAPFHLWYPNVIEGINWINIIIITTWQKIAPIILIIYNFKINYFFCLVILISIRIRGLKGWNQTSLKKILALSSINHIGWIIGIIFLNQSLWILYFSVYILISTNLILVFNKFSVKTIYDLIILFNINKNTKFFFLFNLFSIGGIPPFIGFFPKWIILKILIENELYFLAFIIIFLTLLRLYVYIRIILQPLILKVSKKKQTFKNFDNYYILFINFLNIAGLIIFTIIYNLY